MDVDTVKTEQEISLPSQDKEIQIPIEFIPTTQSVTVRQYTASEIAAVKKMVIEAKDTKTLSKPIIKTAGIYSLNRTKAALQNYLLDIREVIEKNKFNSNPEDYRKIVGNVTIRFSISADGVFSNIQIAESSSDINLDKSALSAVKIASGKAKRPKTTGAQTIKASVVVKYQYGL
jgi:TonB family protein